MAEAVGAEVVVTKVINPPVGAAEVASPEAPLRHRRNIAHAEL